MRFAPRTLSAKRADTDVFLIGSNHAAGPMIVLNPPAEPTTTKRSVRQDEVNSQVSLTASGTRILDRLNDVFDLLEREESREQERTADLPRSLADVVV